MSGPANIDKWPFPDEMREQGINTHEETPLYYNGKLIGNLAVTNLSYEVGVGSIPRVTIEGYLR